MTKITDLSGDSSSFEDNEESRVRKFSKNMLKSTLFIGTFIEKRYVEPLNSYRDVIKISDDETDFIDNLKAVKKRCSRFFPKNFWIGMTEPKTIGAPAGYNLWVTLNEEVFGSYWYKVKNVEFFQNEVRVKLEIVRPVKRDKTPTNITSEQIFEDVTQNNLKNLSFHLNDLVDNLFTEIITWTNIKNTTVFMFLLISTLLTFLVHTIKYLMDYSLKVVHEISGFVKVCTPIIISFMKLVMNTINGLYMLIAVMWRDRSQPKNPQIYYDVPVYQSPYYQARALPYYGGNFPKKRSTVKITPLD